MRAALAAHFLPQRPIGKQLPQGRRPITVRLDQITGLAVEDDVTIHAHIAHHRGSPAGKVLDCLEGAFPARPFSVGERHQPDIDPLGQLDLGPGGPGNAAPGESVRPEVHLRANDQQIERALALTDAAELTSSDLALQAVGVDEEPSEQVVLRGLLERGLTLEQLQDLYTEQVLASCDGNKVRAAATLGIDRKTLYRRAERKARQAAPH